MLGSPLIGPSMPSTAHESWAPGPHSPRLGAGVVDVWRADLGAVGEEIRGLLCEEERDRAARLLSARDRELWMSARGLLRALLGRYLGREPATLRFVLGEHGKPALLEDTTRATSPGRPIDSQPPPTAFNLSHSGGRALYAFTEDGAVGVDVECARRRRDEVGIASRTFGAREGERLAGLDPALREREFLRLWVRHEASLKYWGTGIGAAAEASRPGPWVQELQMEPRTAAAVALEHAPDELRCWDWPPV
jgi:4'-phosphopantetheinyl transferase